MQKTLTPRIKNVKKRLIKNIVDKYTKFNYSTKWKNSGVKSVLVCDNI